MYVSIHSSIHPDFKGWSCHGFSHDCFVQGEAHFHPGYETDPDCIVFPWLVTPFFHTSLVESVNTQASRWLAMCMGNQCWVCRYQTEQDILAKAREPRHVYIVFKPKYQISPAFSKCT